MGCLPSKQPIKNKYKDQVVSKSHTKAVELNHIELYSLQTTKQQSRMVGYDFRLNGFVCIYEFKNIKTQQIAQIYEKIQKQKIQEISKIIYHDGNDIKDTFVSEYGEITLENIVKTQKIKYTSEQLSQVLIVLCNAIIKLYEIGIAHIEITPSNIYIELDNPITVKLRIPNYPVSTNSKQFGVPTEIQQHIGFNPPEYTIKHKVLNTNPIKWSVYQAGKTVLYMYNKNCIQNEAAEYDILGQLKNEAPELHKNIQQMLEKDINKRVEAQDVIKCLNRNDSVLIFRKEDMNVKIEEEVYGKLIQVDIENLKNLIDSLNKEYKFEKSVSILRGMINRINNNKSNIYDQGYILVIESLYGQSLFNIRENDQAQQYLDKCFEIYFFNVEKYQKDDIVQMGILKIKNDFEITEHSSMKEALQKVTPIVQKYFKDDKELQVELQLQHGVLETDLGKYKQAQKYFDGCLKEIQDNKIDEKLIAGIFYLEYGYYLKQKQIYEEALSYFEKAKKIILGHKEEFSPEMSRLLIYQGTTYLEIGKLKEAEVSFIKAKDIRQRLYGSKHTSVGYAYDGLGFVYMEMQKEEECLEAIEQAKIIFQHNFDENDMGFTFCKLNIGLIYMHFRKFKEALKLFTEVYELKLEVYKEDHRDVSASLIQIADLYLESSEIQKAEKYYVEALELSRGYGNGICLQEALLKLGQFYMVICEYSKAAEKIEESLRISRQQIEELPESSLLESLRALALSNVMIGKIDEAEGNLREAQQICEEIAGQGSAFSGRYYETYGEFNFILGRYSEAKDNYEKALKILGQKPQLRYKYAYNEICLGNLEEGMIIAEDSFSKMKWKMYENCIDQGHYAILFSTYYMYKKNLSENQEMIQKIHNIHKNKLQDIQKHQFNIMYKYFQAEFEYNNSDKLVAQEIMVDTVSLAKLLYGNNSPLLAQFINKLCSIHIARNEFNEAAEINEFIVKLLESHPLFQQSYFLGEAYYIAGQIAESNGYQETQYQMYYQKAQNIFQNTLEKSHPNFQRL